VAHKRGPFETSGGTLFLDEIGETSLATQVKLLRVLQERDIRRVGSNTSLPVHIRVLTATNKDLVQAMSHGTFRKDLYYRLNFIPFAMPPLHARPDDIPPLAEHFLARYAARLGMDRTTLWRKLKRYRGE
jgi:transcriptional regulator with PAS, ATPase and Fis domain